MGKIFGVLFVVIGVLLASLLSVSYSQGQNCGASRPFRYTNQSYYTPVYNQEVVKEVVTEVITPIAVPVIVPAYNFQYVPAPYCNQTPGIVPGMTPQLLGGQQVANQQVANQQVASQPGYQQQMTVGASPSVAREDQMRLLAKYLLEEMQKQDNPSSNNDDGPPVAQPPGGYDPVSSFKSNITPSSGVHPGMLAMSQDCARCHTGEQAKGGVRIFDSAGVLNPLAPRAKILDAVQSRRMPPPDSGQVNPQSLDNIKDWAMGR